MAMAEDPFALLEDGTPADPAAFHSSLLASTEKVAAIRAQAPAELAAVLLAPAGQLDSDAFKAVLRQVYQHQHARLARFRGDPATWWAERSIDALRASAPVPRDTVQVYEALRAAGLQYGPSFRLLRNIHVPDATQQAAA